MNRGLAIGVFTAVVVCLIGCAAGRAQNPSKTVVAYCEAVQQRDSARVYALLDDPGRLGMDPETFARYFEDNYDGILRQAQELRREIEMEDRVEIRAAVPTAPGDRAELIWRGDQWWLARTAPVRGHQESPQQTLEALRAAVDTQNLEAILALLSAETRAGYLAELDALGTALADGEGKIVAAGDAAVIILANGDQLHLVREEGVWRLHRFQQSGQ